MLGAFYILFFVVFRPLRVFYQEYRNPALHPRVYSFALVFLFRQLDAMRVDSVVRAFVANAAELRPLQRPARKLLPPLLFCMACELLNVRLLGPEVREVLKVSVIQKLFFS